MGVDTYGKIKGYAKPEGIFNFIKQKYDKNAKYNIKRQIVVPIEKVTWEHTFNEHSEDNKNWYDIRGAISFNYKNEARMLSYYYANVNHLENLNYYSELGLEDMVRAETTHIGLGKWGHSVEIVKEIVAHFGGGWIDEDDCDDVPYYPINANEDKSVVPIRYVTMDEIREKFGENIVIIGE